MSLLAGLNYYLYLSVQCLYVAPGRLFQGRRTCRQVHAATAVGHDVRRRKVRERHVIVLHGTRPALGRELPRTDVAVDREAPIDEVLALSLERIKDPVFIDVRICIK